MMPDAEDINYWMTGTSSPDTWLEKAKKQIADLGGKTITEAFGKDETGNAAYLLVFEFADERYKIVWPVLRSRSGKEKAARIQAATMLYHHVKALCISATVLGRRQAFFSHLLLPDGRATSELAMPEIVSLQPELFRPQLPAGDDAVEGSWR